MNISWVSFFIAYCAFVLLICISLSFEARIRELSSQIVMLNERPTKTEEKKPIGEVYCYIRGLPKVYGGFYPGQTFPIFPIHEGLPKNAEIYEYQKGFRKFYKIDGTIKNSEFVKIEGSWHKLENVILYDDIYQPKREEIMDKNGRIKFIFKKEEQNEKSN